MTYQAMILAAGLGTRMRQLTKHMAKPMLPYQGRSLIDHQLQFLFQHGIKKVVINTFYLADELEDFIERLSIVKHLDVYFSRENELLGTAGGVKKALDILGQEPFFLMNTDSLFFDKPGEQNALTMLEQNWNRNNHKMLMLFIEREFARGYRGRGDFDITNGKTIFNTNSGKYVFSGLSLLDYRVFQKHLTKFLEFSPTIFNDLISHNNNEAIVYKGDWYHIGDYEAYQEYSLDVN